MKPEVCEEMLPQSPYGSRVGRRWRTVANGGVRCCLTARLAREDGA
ncbi:uncharacterized protein G2W53_028379 [Senna tora]|uniref:Uncharacterized protein n=1 Tax=Senna tora TaxID=362788 RepID=A0A834T4C8_9FABA|nr:uncharacterized protein G2W53_028379 [Senna tora]